jgi:hypothetical protein
MGGGEDGQKRVMFFVLSHSILACGAIFIVEITLCGGVCMLPRRTTSGTIK